MRTNVVIDDELMAGAIRSGKYKTKKSAIEAGLRRLAQDEVYEKLLALEGKIRWKGNLDEMRRMGS